MIEQEIEQGWNAVDLHMHTFIGIDGKGKKDNVNFTYCLFEEKIRKHNLKLIAPLGHNKIDLVNLLLSKYICKINNCNALPSVELDLKVENIDDLHCVLIFNEDLQKMFKFSNFVEEKVNEGEHKKCVRFNSDDVVDILRLYDVIIIPHGDKDRGYFQNATEENIKSALVKVKEGFIHAFDSFGVSKWKLEKVKSFINTKEYKELVDEFKGLMFSDVHNWNEYDNRFHDFYMNAEPTFRGLLHSISGAENRFNVRKYIPKKSNYISKIVLTGTNNRKRVESTTLYLSPGYNCIIGNSGSGKSLLIHLINKALGNINVAQNNNYSDYSSTKVELYDENSNLITPNQLLMLTGDSLFKWIIGEDVSNETVTTFAKRIKKDYVPRSLLDSRIDKFKIDVSNFVDLLKKRDSLLKENNDLFLKLKQFVNQYKKLKGTKTFDIGKFNNVETKYEFITDDIFSKGNKSLDIIGEQINSYAGEYKNDFVKKMQELKKVYRLIQLDINYTKSQIILMQKKYDLVCKIMMAINEGISRNSKTKNDLERELPNLILKLSTNILDLYKVNLQIEKQEVRFDISGVKKIKTCLSNRNVSIEEHFDESQVKKYEYKSEIIFKLYGKKGGLLSRKTYYDLTNSIECKELIKLYYKCKVFEQKEIAWKDNSNLQTKSIILFDDQNIEELNPGTIAKKNVEMYFEDEIQKRNPQIVVFDQIGNDVDKTFISTTIKNEIQKTKDIAQLLIVTHDPIVAVNADPTNYIECKKEKGKISYRSFFPEANNRDELKTIADIVDGSKNVIRKRYQIYERENDYGNKNY